MSQIITPSLWFDTEAEEAAGFYVSVFKNSRVGSVARYPEDGPALVPGAVGGRGGAAALTKTTSSSSSSAAVVAVTTHQASSSPKRSLNHAASSSGRGSNKAVKPQPQQQQQQRGVDNSPGHRSKSAGQPQA